MALNLADYKKIQIPDNNYRALEYIELNEKFFDLGTTTFTYCFEVDANIEVWSGYANYIFGYGYNTGESGSVAVNARIARMSINSSGYPSVYFGKKETSNSHMGSVSLTNIASSIDEKRCLYRMYVNGNGINLDVENSSGTLIGTGYDTYTSDAIGSEKAGLGAIYNYSTTYGRMIWSSGFHGKIYSFKVRSSKGGSILQEWVPAQRKTDSKNGLYNKITGEFMLPYSYNVDTDTKTQVSATAGPITEEHPSWVQQWEVKKIVDSNGVMIWGSQAAFPYRRLEYLETSGTGPQAIDTGFAPDRTSYMLLRVADKNVNDGPQGRGAVQNNQRFAAGYKQGGFFFGLGNGWIGPVGTAGTSAHTIGVQGPECNVLNNAVGTSTKKQGYYIDGSFTVNTNTYPASSTTWYTVFILGSRGNTSGEIQQTIPCKMYWAEYGHTSGTSKVVDKKLYPCQRKSDGKLGFYDTVNNTFLYQLVEGSDTDTISAGPVVDEYWDLTAPSN